MSKRDYYEVLHVDRDADEREIAKAYRKMAVKYHPDSNPGDEQASHRFKEAAEAYEVLSDPDKRARYDRFGHAGVDSNGAGFSSAEDIFAAFGEMFGGGLFGDFFGSRSQAGRRARKGDDVRVDVSVTLEEVANGATREIRFNRHRLCSGCRGSGSRPGSEPQRCGHCGGRGQVIQSAGILSVQTTCPACRGAGARIVDPCPDCRGRGMTAEKARLDVTIPPGVDEGMRVRLSGEGDASIDGGPAGDCYCFISVKQHPLFHRDQHNLIVQIPLTCTQAILGTELDVPTLSGPESITIPRGTQSGEVFKLAGRGLPDPRQPSRRGDLLIQTYIEIPKKVSAEQEKLFRKIAELEQTDVLPERKNFLERIRDYFGWSAPAETNGQ